MTTALGIDYSVSLYLKFTRTMFLISPFFMLKHFHQKSSAFLEKLNHHEIQLKSY